MKLNPALILLASVILLLIIGLSFLSAISAPASFNRFGTIDYYFFHQILYGLLPGIVAGLAGFFVPIRWIKKIVPWVILVALLSMVSVLLPFLGSKLWGAKRWLDLGFFGFQPSEFFKLAAILYLGSLLSNRIKDSAKPIANFKHKNFQEPLKKVFLPFLFFLAVISVMLLLQRDVTTLLIIFTTSLAIYIVAGTPLWQSIVIIIGGALSFFAMLKFEPYRLQRVLVFLNPDLDPMGVGYQIRQALIAIGSGGFFGRGMGLSGQKLSFLPQSMSDSTFAIFAEEMGWVGCLFLLFLFFTFLWAGFNIAKNTDNGFCRLVAFGICFWIIFQGFVNIASMIKLMPMGGVPLPFIGYGGSHLIAELAGVGILLNIAKRR